MYFSVHWGLLPLDALCTKGRDIVKAVSDCSVIKYIVDFYQMNH